jgi:KaiC/GvpD/RAD55 family RecA-like ATPase
VLPRVSSGVPGVDTLMGGGFPRQRCIVVQGGPGSGKSTFAAQFLYSGAVNERQPGVYVTLSESPKEIIENNMASHKWDLAKLEKKGLLNILDARPVVSDKEGLIAPNEQLFRGELLPFSRLLDLMIRSVKKTRAKRLALDSLTVLTMQYANRFYVRQGVLGLIQALSSLDCTSLLIVEDLAEDQGMPIEVAVAPGVVTLSFERRGDVMARSFQILKMRGVKHSLQLYHMEIEDDGVRVFPEEPAISK